MSLSAPPKSAARVTFCSTVATTFENTCGYKSALSFSAHAGLNVITCFLPHAFCIQGNELTVELHLPKGPEIGKQMSRQISWQLEHPEGTREQCVSFLREALSTEKKCG